MAATLVADAHDVAHDVAIDALVRSERALQPYAQAAFVVFALDPVVALQFAQHAAEAVAYELELGGRVLGLDEFAVGPIRVLFACAVRVFDADHAAGCVVAVAADQAARAFERAHPTREVAFIFATNAVEAALDQHFASRAQLETIDMPVLVYDADQLLFGVVLEAHGRAGFAARREAAHALVAEPHVVLGIPRMDGVAFAVVAERAHVAVGFLDARDSA